MKKTFFSILFFFHAALIAGTPVDLPFKNPTDQLVKRETWLVIDHSLKQMKIPKNLYPYFSKITHEEHLGLIGYHGSSQNFRIYQDLIRFTIEEILKIPVPDDFHFLRIPGDADLNLNSVKEFKEYWGKLDNRDSLRSKQLLSLNYALYSNFDSKGSCSLNLFVTNKNNTDVGFKIQLFPLFTNLGIPLEALDELVAIAEQHLNKEGGILLQIFDNSYLSDQNGEAYNFANIQCYPSKRGGYLYDNLEISDHIERIMSDLYLKHKLNASPQLRLLINNKHTLNPFSHLQIKRWDFYDSKTIETYEAEMRAYFRNLPYEASKVEKYRQKLMKMWDV